MRLFLFRFLCFLSFISSSFLLYGEIKVEGVLKFDEALMFESKKSQNFPSGANLRSAELSFSESFSDKLKASFDIDFSTGAVQLGPAFLNYNWLPDHSSLLIGNVPSPFCLEHSNSSKWLPFMERPMAVSTFAPCIGPGALFHYWSDLFMFKFAVTQPSYGLFIDPSDADRGSDKINTASRLVLYPVNTSDSLVAVGINVNTRSFSKDVEFSTYPEMRARRTAKLVNTTRVTEGQKIRVASDKMLGFGGEGTVQWKNLAWQNEYFGIRIATPNGNQDFSGWYSQLDYVLTGENRSYKLTDFSFGQIEPKGNYGAWQIAARYSTINLNSTLVKGGDETNIGLSLNWIASRNVVVIMNYIRAVIHPGWAVEPETKNLDMLGLRLQVVL